MEANDQSQPLIRGTTVGEVLDANNAELKVFIENFKKEYRKQWQSTASAILKSVGINENVVDILQIRDVCELQDCASPVRKKQKSNDYDNSARLRAAAQPSSEPPKINHGLSDEELVRIHKLKRVDLMDEIEGLGGEYHKSWSKGSLVEALLKKYAMFNFPPTGENDFSIIPSTEVKAESSLQKDFPAIKSTVKKAAVALQKQKVISDFEMVSRAPSSTAITSTAGENVQNHMQSEVARPIADAQRTMNGKNDINGSKKSNSSSSDNENEIATSSDIDVCMSTSLVAEPPTNAAASNVDGASNMDVDETSTSKALLSSAIAETFDDDIFEFDNVSQSQQGEVKQHIAAKYFTPALSQIPGSDVKPPRKSPSVPVGIVDSAKKQLLSSQKKVHTMKSQHLAHSMVAQKLDLEQKAGNFNVAASLSNRTMLMPTFDNSKGPLSANSGFSDKVKASTEARNERIAQVKALSKKTIPKTVAMTATSASSGTKYINSQLTVKTFSSSKLDPKDRFAEIRAKHQNQQYIEQECQSDIKTVPVNEIKYAFPNPVATIKKTSPTRPALKSTVTTPPLTEEFVCYEMTDGEYDSDDDDASAARASKRIPDWARSANLTKALEVQYSKNFSIDPDELFGEVETCNLEAIFGLTYPKFRRRNSSGDWTKHRVTSEEKRMYKRHIENS